MRRGRHGKKVKRDREIRRKRRMYLLRKYKTAKGCENCGYNKHGVALDFAHIDNMTKSIYITRNATGSYGMGPLISRIHTVDLETNRRYLRALFTEIRKCKILCSNCHQVETEEAGEASRWVETSKNRGGSYQERTAACAVYKVKPKWIRDENGTFYIKNDDIKKQVVTSIFDIFDSYEGHKRKEINNGSK